MAVTLERVQFKFASIIGELCSEPDILSQFAVWVDLRLAEYKLKGSISLDCCGDTPDPAWLKGIVSALLVKRMQWLPSSMTKQTSACNSGQAGSSEETNSGVTPSLGQSSKWLPAHHTFTSMHQDGDSSVTTEETCAHLPIETEALHQKQSGESGLLSDSKLAPGIIIKDEASDDVFPTGFHIHQNHSACISSENRKRIANIFDEGASEQKSDSVLPVPGSTNEHMTLDSASSMSMMSESVQSCHRNVDERAGELSQTLCVLAHPITGILNSADSGISDSSERIDYRLSLSSENMENEKRTLPHETSIPHYLPSGKSNSSPNSGNMQQCRQRSGDTPAGKRRRVEISLAEKVQLIHIAENTTPRLTQSDLASQFSVGRSTVSEILKKKDIYIDQYSKIICRPNDEVSKVIRGIRKGKYETLNELLWQWFQQAKADGSPLSGPILQEQALNIAQQLMITDFKASNGWLDCWRRRYCVKNFKTVGADLADAVYVPIEKISSGESLHAGELQNSGNVDIGQVSDVHVVMETGSITSQARTGQPSDDIVDTLIYDYSPVTMTQGSTSETRGILLVSEQQSGEVSVDHVDKGQHFSGTGISPGQYSNHLGGTGQQ